MWKINITNSNGSSLELVPNLYQNSIYPVEVAVTDLTGFTQNFNVDYVTEKIPYKQGAQTVDITTDQRILSFNIHVLTGSNEKTNEYFRDIVSLLNPFIGEVVVTYTGINGKITSTQARYLSHNIIESTKVVGYKVMSITLVCDSPFFKDQDYTTEVFGDQVQDFKFDFTLPTYFSWDRHLDTVEVKGDYTVSPDIYVFGPASGVAISRIYKNVISNLKIDYSIGEDEYVHINTTVGKESINLYDINDNYIKSLVAYMDLTDEYIQLYPGANTIGVQDYAGENYPVVAFRYKNNYLSSEGGV